MDVVLLALYLCHVFALISWLGAMYFNLVLIFPGYRRASSNIDEEKRLYQVQGTRAGYWLYAFIAITAVSGVLLVVYQYGAAALATPIYLVKLGLLVLMLACHLVGSWIIWPKIMFALGQEARAPLNAYKLSMLVSATAGSFLIALSYYWTLQSGH